MYYCIKCKKKHVRGTVYTQHTIYTEYPKIVPAEYFDEPWVETCYDCEHHDKLLDQGGHICKLLVEKWDEYKFELSSWGWSFSVPKAAFRVPRTSEIYRKCKYHKKLSGV